MHTSPPLLSLITFCIVSCNLSWLSSVSLPTLLSIPSSTSWRTVLPNILVSHIPPSPLSEFCPEIYCIRSSACCCVPTIGAIYVSIFACIRCTEGLVALSLTPYLLPWRISSGWSIVISSTEGVITP